jgi:hypothetical protein
MKCGCDKIADSKMTKHVYTGVLPGESVVRDSLAPSLNPEIVSLPRSRVVPPHRPQTASSYQKSQKMLDRDKNVQEAPKEILLNGVGLEPTQISLLAPEASALTTRPSVLK